jgi:hypothetical protein
MAHTMRRDLFARGEYERVCHGPVRCAWCGQTRRRVFTYVWARYDRTQFAAVEHRRAKTFGAFDCFTVYHS